MQQNISLQRQEKSPEKKLQATPAPGAERSDSGSGNRPSTLFLDACVGGGNRILLSGHMPGTAASMGHIHTQHGELVLHFAKTPESHSLYGVTPFHRDLATAKGDRVNGRC